VAESFDAVLAEMRSGRIGVGGRRLSPTVTNFADRLQSAHARELDALRTEAYNWELQSDDWQSRGWAVGKDLEKVQGQVAEQQATIEALRTDKAALLNTCANYETLQRETEARTDAAMGLVAKWREEAAPSAGMRQEHDADSSYDAALESCANELEQALAGGKR
jgi:hypothetical protein